MNLSTKLSLLFFCAFILASFQSSIIAVSSVSVNPFSNHDGSMLLAKRTTRKKKKKKRRKKKRRKKKKHKIVEENKVVMPEKNGEDKGLLRRVLILDFINQTNNQNVAYLAVSIPEAFIGPLQNTNHFELLNRDLAKKAATKLGFDASNIGDESKAIEMGKVAGAEVVIVGKFVVIGNKVRMEAKAIDVIAGRISVSENRKSSLNSSIFDKIDALANSMSKKMVTAMPPLTTRTLVAQVKIEKPAKPKPQEKSKSSTNQSAPASNNVNKQNQIYASFLYPYYQALDNSKGVISKNDKMPMDIFSGLGGKLGFATDRFFLPRLYLGIEGSFILSSGNADVVSTTGVTLKSNDSVSSWQADALFFGGFEVLSTKTFGLMPVGGVAITYMNIKAGQTLGAGFLPAVMLGLMFRISFDSLIFRLGGQSFFYAIDGGGNILQHRFEAGVGFKI